MGSCVTNNFQSFPLEEIVIKPSYKPIRKESRYAEDLL